MNNAPIAVFDSGLGGLSVWRELRRRLPRESLYYFGDGEHCPYGPKPREEVIGYVDEAVRMLLDRGVKMVVVACNAATAAAIDYLRVHYQVPFVGMEPAVKPAALSSESGVIGVLATAGTLKGRLYRETAARYAGRVKILEAVGDGFVELVEAHKEQTQEAVDTVRRVVKPMLDAGVDRIVLGCTHYPFLTGALRKVIGGRKVTLIDPAPAVERRVAQLLDEKALSAGEDHEPEYAFFTASDEAYRQGIISKSEQALLLDL